MNADRDVEHVLNQLGGRPMWTQPKLDLPYGATDDELRHTTDLDEANLVGTAVDWEEVGVNTEHLPLYDIDDLSVTVGMGTAKIVESLGLRFTWASRVRWIESSHPGNWHVYVDVPVKWNAYARSLIRLSAAPPDEHGLVDMQWAITAIERRQGFLRLPWIRKETPL